MSQNVILNKVDQKRYAVYSIETKIGKSNFMFPGQLCGQDSAYQCTWVRSLGGEDPLEKEIATHFSILAWKISWAEEPGGLQFMGSQTVRHD